MDLLLLLHPEDGQAAEDFIFWVALVRLFFQVSGGSYEKTGRVIIGGRGFSRF